MARTSTFPGVGLHHSGEFFVGQLYGEPLFGSSACLDLPTRLVLTEHAFRRPLSMRFWSTDAMHPITQQQRLSAIPTSLRLSCLGTRTYIALAVLADRKDGQCLAMRTDIELRRGIRKPFNVRTCTYRANRLCLTLVEGSLIKPVSLAGTPHGDCLPRL